MHVAALLAEEEQHSVWRIEHLDDEIRGFGTGPSTGRRRPKTSNNWGFALGQWGRPPRPLRRRLVAVVFGKATQEDQEWISARRGM